MTASAHRQRGLTLTELLITIALAAMLLAAVSGVFTRSNAVRNETQSRVDALRDAEFAMHRMVNALAATERLLLPLADNPNTTWREHVREQTIPASPPDTGSTFATAVLAVTLDPSIDIDGDGFADADNDKDGKVDEDFPNDVSNDSSPGLIGIDDDGDGAVDEATNLATTVDDDEDGFDNEDDLNGIDDDLDGTVDEDFKKDMNKDGQPGVAGVDDDGDGLTDEGFFDDDDEDGLRDEDWYDAVVFYLNGGTLVERLPNLNPVNGSDFTEYMIAENVTLFRVERIPAAGKRATLVDITLEVRNPQADPVRLQTRVRARTGR